MTQVFKKIFSGVLFLAVSLAVSLVFSHQALASASSTSFTMTAVSGTYGGTSNVTATLHASSTMISGKTVTFTLRGRAVGATTTNSIGVATLVNANLYGIDASSTYTGGVRAVFAGDAHYNTCNGAANLTINKAPLTVSGVSAIDKVYDRLLTATINTHGAVLVGIINSENITLSTSSATGAFTTKTVGVGKTVNISSLALGGTATTSNYSLTQPTVSASITAKSLGIGGASASNKVYDGGTTAAINVVHTSLGGVIGGDTVTYSTSSAVGTFNNKNIGTGKTVTITGITLGGADGGNYSFISTTTVANITARPITVTAAANSKIYDGLLTAATVPTITSGTLAVGDTGTFAQAYDSKNVGSSRVLTPSGTVADGSAADMTSNYSITFTPIATGVISLKTLVASVTVSNKYYNGNAAASIAGCSLTGVVGTDNVSCTGGTATFSDALVGSGKTVNVTGLSLSGTDAGNYTSNNAALATADIIGSSAGVSNASNFCTNIVYSDWQSCFNGMQYRNVLSQSPSYCTFTPAQQAARSMACSAIPVPAASANPVVPTQSGISPSGPVNSEIPASNPNLAVYSFIRNLSVGVSGTDVLALQKFLNARGFIIAKSGAGSAGRETNKFGGLTRQALIKFQKAHNIFPAVGFFGPATRAFVNSK